MRVGLLGDLEVLDDDGCDVPVAGAKLRALLAVLALDVGRVVPADRLVEALWGEDPPAAVRNGLQGLVSKLRRTLGAADLVAMRGGGYVLEVPVEAVDVHRYEELVAAGRLAAAAGELERAVERLAEADSLWRGNPLADFAYDDFAAAATGRLSELRLSVIEEQLDLQLQLGRHQPAIVPLEALVAAHPLREGLRGLLMRALYRSGRQADALRAFQEGRKILGDELGLEPGPDLRRLEAAILAHDPALDALTGAGPASASAPVHRGVIPESLTPLVGRDEELEQLTGLAGEHRLITLVGPGGVGKTRLALEAARGRSAALAHGGYLVELAPVGDPAGVRAAVASVLGLPDPTRLAELIGDRQVLILLDNCEHVIATAAEVADDLLRHCAGLRLLATSREGLRVGGEVVWPVPPLAAADAVELFVARARAAGSPLELTDEVLPVVSDICARLDGLPLAIELAAARTRAFPIPEIASRLNDRFRLLTGGSRTALPRQQTLRAVVDWSYELLFDDEQRLFERLSVFPGGCDLATAEAVCSDDALGAAEVADVVHALVDKSLLIAVPVGDDLRFTQLQTLAQYARGKLTERGDTARTRDAMAAHFADLCSQSAAAYTGSTQRAWLMAIDAEADNVRAALEWAVANDDAETALTIAGGTSWPHWLSGSVIEGKRWLDDAFACGGEASDRARGLGLIGRGLIDFLAGVATRPDDDLEAALAIFRALGDQPSISLAHSFYAEQPNVIGDVEEARRRRLEHLALLDGQPQDAFVAAARAYSLGKLAVLDDDLAEAEAQYRDAAARFASIDRPIMTSMTLGIAAEFDERAGDHAAAVEKLEAAIETNDALGLKGLTGALVARLGWMLLHTGDLDRAEAMYDRALDMARWLRNAPVVFLALVGSAVVHRLRGRDEAAVRAASEALQHHATGTPQRFRNRLDPRSEVWAGAASCWGVLAAIAAERDNPEAAAALLGQADQLWHQAQTAVPPFQRDDLEAARATAEARLAPEAFAVAYQRGRRASVEDLLSSLA